MAVVASKRKGKTYVVKTIAEVAHFFDVSMRTVDEWIASGAPFLETTGGKRTGYDLSEMMKWCRQNVWIPRRSGQTAGGDDSETELKKEKLRLENEKRRLDLEAKRGELVRRDAVLPAVMQQYAQVRSRLEALPEELAASYPPEIRVDLIADSKHKISLALRELEAQSVPGATAPE